MTKSLLLTLSSLMIATSLYADEPKFVDKGFSGPDSSFHKGLAAFAENDYELAAALFKESAEQGEPDGQYELGILYLEGMGVDKEPEQTFELWSMSAEKGYADAQFGLGTLYMRGIGIDKDIDKAKTWLQKAASQGHVAAQERLDALESQ